MNLPQTVAGVLILAVGFGMVLWWLVTGQGLENSARDLVSQAKELSGAQTQTPLTSTSDPEVGWTVLRPWPREKPLTRDAWAHLPPGAVRYFDRVGVWGKTPVESFALVMKGRIRQGPESPWMDIVMRQYNHMDPPARIVFIRTTEGPMTGVDSWVGGQGRMVIRLFNLITLTDNTGPEMDVSAQVTFLNDLVFCPLGYFSLTTEWKEEEDGRLRLRMNHMGRRVEAELEIGPEGDLENWRSSHRYAEVQGKNIPDRWETPLTSFGDAEGLRIPSGGRGVHNLDGQPYDYFEITSMPNLEPDAPGLPDAWEEK